MKARDYQEKDLAAIYQHWADGAANVVYQCPTGGGKTFVMGKVMADYNHKSATIAHRGELVFQQSMTLAAFGKKHRLITNKNLSRFIMNEQVRRFGRHFIDPMADAAAVAVDTLIARYKEHKDWCGQVALWGMDECHHVLCENKWGEAVNYFPNARGLGTTATPNRADGKGIGRHALGVFDTMVQGPTVSELIGADYLSDYRIIAPPSDFNEAALKEGGTGDFTRNSMKKATEESHIIGDVVTHYERFANGQRAIVFAIDVEDAQKITAAFVQRGHRAAAVSGKSNDSYREDMVGRFRRGELEILVNVDLFGEGFDVPECYCVIMARMTASLPLYLQMFGRALRAAKGKEYGIIIDHVSNVKRHLLPDTPRTWSLDNRNKRQRATKDDEAFPIKVCANPDCMLVYEAFHPACPFCGFKPVPGVRSTPQQVDGDLTELDHQTLAQLRGERVDLSSAVPMKIRNGPGSRGIQNIKADRYEEKQDAQRQLREVIACWAAHGHAKGRSDAELYRRFYHRFGVDVLTAQTLSASESVELTNKIIGCLYE